MKSEHILYHTQAVNGQQGVGFQIHKSMKNDFEEVKQVSKRIAGLNLKISSKLLHKKCMIQLETSNTSEEEVEELYEELYKLDSQYKIVIGDFNAKVGTKQDHHELPTGKYESGVQNDGGKHTN